MATASRKKKSHLARLNATRPHPTVGAAAYPKGTGSGSRSYLAGRHWRPAARLAPRQELSAKLTDKGATPTQSIKKTGASAPVFLCPCCHAAARRGKGVDSPRPHAVLYNIMENSGGDRLMKRGKGIVILLLGAMMMFSLFGCGKKQYRLNYDGYGFESRKTAYAAGDTVTVYFNLIATDTRYDFALDDDAVALEQGYDPQRGYVFTFTMPDHDVTLSVSSENTMLRDSRP